MSRKEQVAAGFVCNTLEGSCRRREERRKREGEREKRKREEREEKRERRKEERKGREERERERREKRVPEHVKESEQVCTRASGGPPLHPPCVSCPGFLETDS